jgi:HK97 gp10 family phage protein
MGSFTVHIEGLRELDAKLAELGGAKGKQIVNKALRAGGLVFVDAIQERAPERPDLPSGTALPPGALAADIGERIGRDEEGFAAAIIGPQDATAHVARWVEYGHRLVKGGYSKSVYRRGVFVGYRGPGRAVDNVPAHPFIRPAFEAATQEAIDKFVATTKEGVEAAAKE